MKEKFATGKERMKQLRYLHWSKKWRRAITEEKRTKRRRLRQISKERLNDYATAIVV